MLARDHRLLAVPGGNMPTTSRFRRPRRDFPLAFALAAALFAVAAAVSPARDAMAESPAATGGLQVHVDPQTGRFVETPPSGAGAATPPAPAASAPVIDVQPSPVPGGGFGFEIPDSLHPEIKATTTPDGKAHVACGEAGK
jgi:hypothetical protein